MADCTDLPFRLVSRRRGLGFAFTEMVSAKSLLRKSRKTLDILKTRPEDKPLGAQILGGEPASMAEAAAFIEELGFDLVDINCGCPVRKVVSNGDGAALLKDPDRAERIFAAVRRATKLPLTVKMRIGFLDGTGQEAAALARRAEAQGVDAITVHGRTQGQGYGGVSDCSAIALVRRSITIPVIGNGDVRSWEDARRLRSATGCAGVMIGRGGLGNPWLYREIEEERPARISLEERKEALLEHFDLEVECQGERQAALNIRRIGAWYVAGLHGAKQLRVALCRSQDCRTARQLIVDFFGTQSMIAVRN